MSDDANTVPFQPARQPLEMTRLSGILERASDEFVDLVTFFVDGFVSPVEASNQRRRIRKNADVKKPPGAGYGSVPRGISWCVSRTTRTYYGLVLMSIGLRLYLRALISSINCGMTLKTSPTIPRSQIWKMGASASLLTATISLESFMPARCCTAPERPQAM